ncbi:DUF2771 domain-containing protein [Streptomyces sp. NA04227]|uniref:DUF2771 domain-containing protein n=1 Tax=Streptomyces sp. NA04227 TaxID=2742136 RepID=UPI0015925745|nr:DUF2771 domain-containing protein [Streptomyces sp. NA04227]QKW07229.1 DUF2771 domain-containing protein [Streptomyces sp. NA04227]
MTSLPAAEPHVTSAPAHRRRAVAVLGAVSAGLLALSACDKPTPVVTITVGTDSVNSEASCYDEDKPLKATEIQDCLQDDKDIESISVDPDETVRFGVDKKIADEGWVILLNGQPATNPSKKTYMTLPGSAFFNPQLGIKGDDITISIAEGSGKDVHGLWSFKLKKDS